MKSKRKNGKLDKILLMRCQQLLILLLVNLSITGYSYSQTIIPDGSTVPAAPSPSIRYPVASMIGRIAVSLVSNGQGPSSSAYALGS